MAANATRAACVASHPLRRSTTRAQRAPAPQRRAWDAQVRGGAPGRVFALSTGRGVVGAGLSVTSGPQALSVGVAPLASEPGVSSAAPTAALGVTLHEDGEVSAAPRAPEAAP